MAAMFEVAIIGNLPVEQASIGRFKGAAIVAKPLGSVWGAEERKYFRVVEWPVADATDQAVFDELDAQVKAGVRNPVVSYPFRDGTIESTRGVDINALSSKEKADPLDTTKESTTLKAVDVVKIVSK